MKRNYGYIYDACLSEKSYERWLLRLEAEIAQKGIQGQVVKVGGFRKPKDIIKEFLTQGVQTIVVVGEESLFLEVMSLVLEQEVVLGYLTHKAQSISQTLHLPMAIEEQVSVISARFVTAPVIMKVGKDFGLSKLDLDAKDVRVLLGTQLTLSSQDNGKLIITPSGKSTEPLSIMIETASKKGRWNPLAANKSDYTVLQAKTIVLSLTKSVRGHIDGRDCIIEPSTLVEIIEPKCRWIMGRTLPKIKRSH